MNLQSMTIGKRFIVTSSALLLLSTILTAVSCFSFTTIGKYVHAIDTDTGPGIYYAEEMSSDLATLRGDQLRAILAESDEDIRTSEKSSNDTREQLRRDMSTYGKSISDETVDRPNFAKLQPMLDAIDKGWAKEIPYIHSNNDKEALRIQNEEVKPYVNAMDDQMTMMTKWNSDREDATVIATQKTVNTGLWLSLCLGVGSIVLGIGLSWLMISILNKQLNQSVTELTEGSDQVSSAATEVSSSSQSLARDTSEQAAMIEETSASAEEINAMAKRNTDSAQQATTLVVEAVKSTEQTNRAVADCVQAMDAIGDSSSRIAKTLQLIDKIAFQTNILALNAAVEAARAGEAGMGFAVVAEEVRNLAQRCAAASEEISGLIEQSLGNSDQGRAKMATLVESGEKVNQVFAQMKVLVEEISLSSEEQGRGIDQIGRAIQKMEQGTQKSAANAEQSAAAAEQLNAQSEALRSVADVLSQMAGISSGGAQRSIAPTRHKPAKASSFSLARPQAKQRPAFAAAPSAGFSSGSDGDFTEF